VLSIETLSPPDDATRDGLARRPWP
jgi:hypothetical protein